jgi:hypothetical protein
MRLYEFVDPEDDNARAASIIAIANQLKQHVDQGKIDADDFSLDQLLDYFQKSDIILDPQDLYSMIQKVDSSPQQQDQNQKTVSNMAKSALKSRT